MTKTTRRHVRIPVSIPATVGSGEHRLGASVKNISLGGLFMFTDIPFREGAEIDVVLMLPKELGLPASSMVCCHGRVVRVQSSGGQFGVGAEIEQISGMPQL